MLSTHIFVVLSTLKLELPYTLFQMKAILLEIAVKLSVLHPGFLCRQKSLSHSSGAGSRGRVMCLKWPSYVRSRLLGRDNSLSALAMALPIWNLHPTN